MKKIMLYDGSFAGLLCCIYWSFTCDTPLAYQREHYRAQLFDQTIDIGTDQQIAQMISARLCAYFGSETYRKLLYAYCSEHQEAACHIIDFIHFAKAQPELIANFSHRRVYPVQSLARKVSRERHAHMGLMRFAELNSGIYYASYQPKYKVTQLLVDHFRKRLNDQMWVIHDIKRQYAAFYDGERIIFNDLAQSEVEYSNLEDEVAEIWRSYYREISIESRASEARRINHMPKRHWRHLTEFKHE